MISSSTWSDYCQVIDHDYVQRKRQMLAKKSGTYPKLADPKNIPKETLTYPMRYMAQNLRGVTTDISSHKNSLAD